MKKLWHPRGRRARKDIPGASVTEEQRAQAPKGTYHTAFGLRRPRLAFARMICVMEVSQRVWSANMGVNRRCREFHHGPGKTGPVATFPIHCDGSQRGASGHSHWPLRALSE